MSTRLKSLGRGNGEVAHQPTGQGHGMKSKPFEEIPTDKSLLPAQLGLMLSGGPAFLHEHCDARHKRLGPIYRERLGSHDLVFVANTKMIQTVVANEGQMPHHNIPEVWLLYNQVRGINRGLFFQMGEPWLKLRRAMNKVMLADTARIQKFSNGLVAVNNDLFECWTRQLSSGNEAGPIVVRDVKFELCKWSIEATGLMLFGQRMGCLMEGAPDRRAEQLVASVAAMFAETSKFQLIPPKLAHKLNLGAWTRFARASDTMIELASDLAAQFIRKSRAPGSSESLVRDLLDLGSLNDDEISRSMVDMIIAAADTTSNSAQWVLYMLARHPESQSRILEEAHRLGPLEAPGDAPYLNGFVKEVSRLYPTAPFLARTLDHAILLDGYEIPAGKTIVFSLYTTSRMDEYFADANEFRPERWARSGSVATGTGTSGGHSKTPPEASTRHQKHAYATLPFGIGARMCIGRRLADLETHLLIASTVSRFHVGLADPNEEVKIRLKMILGPDKPIRLRLTPRRARSRI